jgi:hypothetical protein
MFGLRLTTMRPSLDHVTDQDQVRQLGRLLGAAGRAHHAEFGGPNPGWPEWYAAFVHPHIAEHVGFQPTVDEVAEWLRQADESHRNEAPDDPWPPFYARWILERLGD